jgi:hypothetical protein
MSPPAPLILPPIDLPSTAQPISFNKPIARPYQEYMRRRGFDDQAGVGSALGEVA